MKHIEYKIFKNGFGTWTLDGPKAGFGFMKIENAFNYIKEINDDEDPETRVTITINDFFITTNLKNLSLAI